MFIIKKDNIFITSNLEGITRNIHLNCELYEQEFGKEKYLGLLNKEICVSLATNFLDFSMTMYHCGTLIEEKHCFNIAKKWLSDKSLIENDLEELGFMEYYITNIKDMSNMTSAFAAMMNIILDKEKCINTRLMFVHTLYVFGRNERKHESIRQGEFLLEFLKSGKHLFLI